VRLTTPDATRDTFDPGRWISSFYKTLYVFSLHRALHRIFYKPLYVFPLHRAIYRMDRHAPLNQPQYDTGDTFDPATSSCHFIQPHSIPQIIFLIRYPHYHKCPFDQLALIIKGFCTLDKIHLENSFLLCKLTAGSDLFVQFFTLPRFYEGFFSRIYKTFFVVQKLTCGIIYL